MGSLSRFALARPVQALMLIGVVSVVSAIGILRLRADTGFRSYLGPSHAAVREFDEFIEGFGGGLPVAAVWSCRETSVCEDVFDPRSLEMDATVSSAMRRQPGVRRVESPATTAIFLESPDGLEAHQLRTEAPTSEKLALRNTVLSDPMWLRSLVSEDGSTGAIVVELASSESASTIAVVRALQRELARFEEQGFEFHLVGQAVELLITDEDLAADSVRLVPATVALIALVIFVLYRSWIPVGATLLTLGVTLLWTMGFMGWLGWAQNSITQTLAPLIMVIGVADAVHLITSVVGSSASSPEEIGAAARDVVSPCTVTSITTAVALASFGVSGVESLARFGIVAASGVMIALVLSFSLLPVLLLLLPDMAKGNHARTSWDEVLTSVVELAQRRRRMIIAAFSALMALGLVGLSQVRIDVDPYELYGPGSQVVRWARFVEARLRSPDSVEIEMRTPPGSSFEAAGNLGVLASTSQQIEGIPGLIKSRCILGPIGTIRDRLGPEGKNLSGREALFLLSVSEGNAIDPWMSLDRRRARISIEASKMSQYERTEVLAGLDGILSRTLPEHWGYTITGPLAVYFQMVEEIHGTQLRSFAMAAVIVALLSMLFLRSVLLGALAMVPTVAPVVLTLGAMGLLDVPLDMGTAMVATVIVGIAIDDSLHLLEHYRRGISRGMVVPDAMAHSVRFVGRAVITTSLALALGFFSMTFSSWQSIANFGFLSAIAILGALFADLLLLPALISGSKRAAPAAAAKLR
ncbi:MAG: MMPL family transporter [bacterium]|nr:MMPL family transporter [bacterium]